MKLFMFLTLMMALATNCRTQDSQSNNDNHNNDDMKIETILKEVEPWIKIDGIEAVGQGNDEEGKDCIVVVISKPVSELKGDIPKDTYKGFKIQFISSGEIRTQDN